MNNLQRIEDVDLPEAFRNVIIRTEPSVILRSNLQCTSDIDCWIHAFSDKTCTRWNVFKTSPEGNAVRIICMKRYCCHHSAYRKVATDDRNRNKRGISKNTACEAQIKVVIKLTTASTKYKDPYVKNGLPAIITINPVHNHPLESAIALKYLKPNDDVKSSFLHYFKMGMNLSQACRYHENQLMFNGNVENEMILINAIWNPPKRTVQQWFHYWRNRSYGSKNATDSEKILEEKISDYEKEGVIIRYEKNPFCLLVITPLMQRVHNLPCSKDQLFIDSISCCDKKKYSITLLLSATANGALPNAVLITKQQTAAFTTGYKLLQESLDSSFYYQNYANVVMTDNRSAEMTAVKEVWPESENFICTFHVLQYVLRWLEDKSHNIPRDEQRTLLCSFQTILCCYKEENAENAFYAAIEIGKEFPVWQKFLQDQWKNRKKWCLAYRIGLVDYLKNNYAEISIRLLKENVLNRIKAYNILALLDFFGSTMDKFYSRKLRDSFNTSIQKNHLYLEWIFKKTINLNEEDIIMINNNTYTILNEIGNDTYIIDVTTGWCNCTVGMKGIFCEHLSAVYRYFYFKNNTLPSVTMQDQRDMAYVAIGNDMGDDSYFLPPHTNEISDKRKLFVCAATNNNGPGEGLNYAPTPVVYEDTELDIEIVECLSEEHDNSPPIEMNVDDKESLLKAFKSEWDRIFSTLHPSYRALKIATDSLKKIRSHRQLEIVLRSLASGVIRRQNFVKNEPASGD